MRGFSCGRHRAGVWKSAAAWRRRHGAGIIQPLMPLKISFPESLPVSARREEIMEAMDRHQVIIVCGETGSGKTTQLPKIALALGRGKVNATPDDKGQDRKSTRLNSSHLVISYAVFCLKKKIYNTD